MIRNGYWYGFWLSVIVYALLTFSGSGDLGTLLVIGSLFGLIVFGPIGALVWARWSGCKGNRSRWC
jgi:hypothetical protein